MSETAGKKPKFPLPRGYFGTIEFNKQQQHYYREFCENQVRRGLLDERAHIQNQKQVDPTKWKPVRSQHNFQLYRRRDGGLHENDGKPSMLGVGRVEGSIEDVIYGAYDQTDEELRMTAELVEVDFGDGIVLSNMEQGSPTDPYRYLGIKWILTPFPMPAIMPDRDWILLESMGISKDSSGRRYGYHTLYTVELPQCPPFPEVIRGTMWYTFIYRDAGKGMIDVHSQGYFDCLGELIDPITIIGSTQMFNGVFRYMKSSEAKKLTILALENLERKIAMGETPASDKQSLPQNATCSVCAKSRSSNPFSSRRMRVCRICDAVVCKTCRVKKNILVGRQRVQSKVSVCQKCIVVTKTMIVNPADEKYVISREMQVGMDRSHTYSTASTAFDTIATGRYNFATAATRHGVSGTSSMDESSAYSSASVSGYSDGQVEHVESQLNGMRIADGGPGLVLHEESYLETKAPVPVSVAPPAAQAAAAAATASPPPPAPVSEQDLLFAKMLELQESARRAHELTLASHTMMLETNAGTNPQ